MKKPAAFSLIELLIVLAIIAILARIGWPLYTEHLIQTRRAQAKVALMRIASQLERYATIHHGYQGATLHALGISPTTANDHYRLQILRANQDQYEIAAIPQKTQMQDTRCGTLILNQNGEKRLSGTDKIIHCW